MTLFLLPCKNENTVCLVRAFTATRALEIAKKFIQPGQIEARNVGKDLSNGVDERLILFPGSLHEETAPSPIIFENRIEYDESKSVFVFSRSEKGRVVRACLFTEEDVHIAHDSTCFKFNDYDFDSGYEIGKPNKGISFAIDSCSHQIGAFDYKNCWKIKTTVSRSENTHSVYTEISEMHS